jgi:signal transduction histidine kinase
MIRLRIHGWGPPAAIIVAGYALASELAAPHSFLAACYGNCVQSAALLALFVLMLLCARSSAGRVRWFWAAMSLGAGMWLAATCMWTWFEVIARRPVPEPFVGDVVFFMHLVPFMGALALRPHCRNHNHRLDFGGLDFLLLLLWWVYLYLFVVIPWQYIAPNRPQYAFSFQLLYTLENGLLVVMLAVLYLKVRSAWRTIFAALLGAAAVYAAASEVINQAISRDAYYTGSRYDVPLVISMVIFVGVGLVARRRSPDSMESGGRLAGVIASRLAMVAVLSLPFMGVWAFFADTPRAVARYRLAVTVGAAVVLPFLVFLKQHLLDRELLRLWRESQHRYDNLRRFQTQLVQAEKLAGLAQIVSGAAHEINNPLTAILGYSELLEEEPSLALDKRLFVSKIAAQARRVREVVSNLRSFAKEIPGEKTLLNINPLLTDAIELRAIDLENTPIHIESQLASDLPPVLANGNQLLQVCFHIMSNAVDALRDVGGGLLRVSSRREGNHIVIEFADNGPGVPHAHKIFDPFFTTKPVGKGAGLGLSACYGIVQDHKGQIFCANPPQGGATFTIMLPVAEKKAAVPVVSAAAAAAKIG